MCEAALWDEHRLTTEPARRPLTPIRSKHRKRAASQANHQPQAPDLCSPASPISPPIPRPSGPKTHTVDEVNELSSQPPRQIKRCPTGAAASESLHRHPPRLQTTEPNGSGLKPSLYMLMQRTVAPRSAESDGNAEKSMVASRPCRFGCSSALTSRCLHNGAAAPPRRPTQRLSLTPVSELTSPKPRGYTRTGVRPDGVKPLVCFARPAE
ncbi:hypothetical protein AOLI_G00306890 [Acnodon oligacanthus]